MDLGLEAQVEEAVGLVEHEVGDGAERELAEAHEVVEAAGRGHDDLDACARKHAEGRASAQAEAEEGQDEQSIPRLTASICRSREAPP